MADATAPVEVTPQEPAKAVASPKLRLWPGVLIVAAIWGAYAWASIGERTPSKFYGGRIIAPAVGTILMLLWWLFASRIRWNDRGLIIGAFIAVATVTVLLADKTFIVPAMILYALPLVTTAWVVWLVISNKLPWPIRRLGVLMIFLGIGAYVCCVRVDGVTGEIQASKSWRWIPTSEDKLLSELKSAGKKPTSDNSGAVVDLVLQDGDWPGFRGPERNSRLSGVRIATDWEKSPPKQVWRHRIGPGWSSCTIIGDRLFTQEQRGQDEYIVCYNAETGADIWEHRDPARFDDMVSGIGPRGTPTFHEGRIYTLGATGKLNCLNAATGKHYWTADIVKDSGAGKFPQWGYAGSPLISHDLVSVFAGGSEGKSVVAYKIDDGELTWASGKGTNSYSSTQTATIDGVEQILISSDAGLTSLEPEHGTINWHHQWKVEQPRVVQPAILSDTELILGTGMSDGGTRRLAIHREGDQWQVKEKWTSTGFKPYYNDFVILDNKLYGFNDNIFMCLDLEQKGKMRWRARGYGNGQVLLLPDESLLLIMTEQGEVALVEAQPEQHKEVTRIKAIEGKTWNHPVIAHGKLYVRNAEEIACFELPAGSESPETKVSSK